MIDDWTSSHSYTFSATQFFKPQFTIPPTNSYDTLIIFGGPMGVHDEKDYPWLIQEKHHIQEAIKAKKKILGICLGAQLVANALGANVVPNPHKEIGWFSITLTREATQHPITNNLDKKMMAFHWHGDRFEIPKNAIHLATSQACNNQAFLYENRILGLQFHIEMDELAVQKVVGAFSHEIQPAPYIQKKETILANAKKTSTRKILHTLLENYQEL